MVFVSRHAKIVHKSLCHTFLLSLCPLNEAPLADISSLGLGPGLTIIINERGSSLFSDFLDKTMKCVLE